MVPERADIKELQNPEATTTAEFEKWIRSLPNNESPVWSGLPHNAEKVLKEKMASNALTTLWKIQDINSEQITDIDPENGEEEEGKSGGQVKWLTELSDRTDNFLQILPASIPQLRRS